ncbi:20646_t:CDS:2, partial [Entrophospora sp. SA101]
GAMPFLIGTKYDQFVLFSDEEKQAITKQKILYTIKPCHSGGSMEPVKRKSA